uniref:Ribonucleoside-diphosphate reductase n=1 Tax=Hemigrapsus takanoi nimavirus TaxID=2133792 RepID=A0A401IP36_9VIRU|nr:MAG: wsv172-like protein [Hemigrapsus takanoi nimavirus]GBG35360.1 wsv172-like protein [Hemigrapsus takanoi nimavirus]
MSSSMRPQFNKVGCKYVTKRDGQKEDLDVNKIFNRINDASRGLENIDPQSLTNEILVGLHNGISTSDIDEYIADIAIGKVFENTEFDTLASIIVVSNHQRKIKDSFSGLMNRLCVEDEIIDPVYNTFIQENAKVLNEAINYNRDFLFNYFGFKTLKNRQGEVVERPQHMMMRVAVCVSDRLPVNKKQRLEGIIETYEALSLKHYIHATPTLFHACTVVPQLSSCFLLAPRANNAIGLTETFADIARITMNSGGVGLNLQDYPALGSYLHDMNAVSPGSIPMIKTMDSLVNALKLDSGNRRQSAIAVYTEPWHPDIFKFLAMKQIDSDESELAKDLFFGLWMPNLFMKRLEKKNGMWTLMCPKKCPGLSDVWGEDFERLYEQYEEPYPDLRRVPCSDLWSAIIKSQLETGFKDAVNRKSNQKHIGTVKCSNLCTEIMEYSSPDETAVCNLASVAVNTFVDEEDGTFDFGKLRRITKLVTRNLDNVIDVTYYPTEPARRSNLRHRPKGIGVQGLADTFATLGYVFDSAEARELDVKIFENIYYAAVETSCELAKERGVYPSYEGSPASRGRLLFDMWREEEGRMVETTLDWDKLKREKLREYGMCNSYLLAPMPTASTPQILGNNESIEPITSNVYTRKVTRGFFNVVNKHLYKRLMKQGIWSSGLGNLLATTRGSIQDIEGIDADTKLMFRTVWEIPQKSLVEMAAARAPFIDQSQSLNIHINALIYPNACAKVNALHRTTWSMGLKTGLYYMRTRPASNPVQFTVNEKKANETREVLARKAVERRSSLSVEDNWRRGEDKLAFKRAFACRRDNMEGCAACSS